MIAGAALIIQNVVKLNTYSYEIKQNDSLAIIAAMGYFFSISGKHQCFCSNGKN
jgi:hypothetical protein